MSKAAKTITVVDTCSGCPHFGYEIRAPGDPRPESRCYFASTRGRTIYIDIEEDVDPKCLLPDVNRGGQPNENK